MKNITWYNINKSGLILNKGNKSLIKGSVIYAYRFKADMSKMYIGSTIDIRKRCANHKYKSFRHNKYGSKLYKLVNKYGWDNLEFGILEYVSLPSADTLLENKKRLLGREQYYFDMYEPSLNTKKIAGSMLGDRHRVDTLEPKSTK